MKLKSCSLSDMFTDTWEMLVDMSVDVLDGVSFVSIGDGFPSVTSTEPPNDVLCQVYVSGSSSTVTLPPKEEECQSALTVYDNDNSIMIIIDSILRICFTPMIL